MKLGLNLKLGKNTNTNSNEPKKPLDKTTVLSYVGIGILSLLIILPPIFRLTFEAPYVPPVATELTRITMKCVKNDITTNYTFSKMIENIYDDNTVVSSLFSFEVYQRPGADIIPTLADVESEEFDAFLAITDKNVKITSTETKKTFTFDYKKYDFSSIDLLKGHRWVAAAQLNEYRTAGYTCDTNTETVDLTK